METLQIKQGDTLSGIASSRGMTVDALLKLNPTIKDPNKIFAGASLNVGQSTPQAPTTSTITNPVDAPTPTSSPNLPQPQAPQIQESFFTSSTENVANTRKALEDTYKSELDRITKEKEEAQKRRDEIEAKQEVLLETDIKDLTQPFREDFENKERERLYITENFEANQALTRELESLLTEGNEIIKRQKGAPLALSVLNKKVNKTISDITARTGVIQAVMSARSNQIGEAYRLIDRSLDAMTADRKDQLDYYSTILDFYEGQKDEEGKKIAGLDKDQKEYIQAQIGLIEHDFTTAEKNAQNIKDLMTDPQTALFMAQAGVTLNDSPAEVSKKMAAQAERQEVIDLQNKLTLDGYKFSPVATDSTVSFKVGGKTLNFIPPPKKGSSGTVEDFEFSSSQTSKLVGAGISVGDIGLIQQSINENGVKATLAAIDNEVQRSAVANALDAFELEGEVIDEEAILERSTEELITSILDTATDEQIKKLKRLADDAGVSGFFSGKKKDIKKLFETPEMAAVLENANAQGLTVEEVIEALIS